MILFTLRWGAECGANPTTSTISLNTHQPMKLSIASSSKRTINRRAIILASSIASLFATEKAAAASATWTGATNALWALDSNWSAPFPVLGETATFDNAGNGNVIIDLGAGVTVGNITFDSAAVAAYTLGGGAVGSQSLTLGNAGTISQTGTGALNLSNTTSTFSGGVTIGAAAGVVTATTFNGTNATGLGSGAVSIGAGSTVNLLSTNTVLTATTINNLFTGTGLLKLTFTGTTATNTLMNGLAGFGGTLQLSNTGTNGDKLNTNANMGNIAASLVIDSGSSLFVSGNSTTNFAGGITLSGVGNSENRGVIRLGAGVLGGNISLGGSSTIGLEGGYLTGGISASVASTLTFGGVSTGNGTLSGVLADGAGQFSLTKSSTGALWLTGANTYTGATTIASGRLQLGLGGTTGSLNPASAITVTGGSSSLTFNRSNAMA